MKKAAPPPHCLLVRGVFVGAKCLEDMSGMGIFGEAVAIVQGDSMILSRGVIFDWCSSGGSAHGAHVSC